MYDGLGRLQVMNTTSSFLELSAAASNDVFTTVWDHSLWERTGGGVWHQLQPANAVL
jgi:hypothetical protein